MATAAGMIGSCRAAFSSSLAGKGMSRGRRQNMRSPEEASIPRTTTAPGVRCAYGGSTHRLSSRSGGSALMDQYRTLRIQPGASEGEVKKAFRKLALQYHPDVCKGGNCGVQFHRINEAYDMVMNSLREDQGDYYDDALYVEDDDDNEWMGFECGWTPNHASHRSPYI